MGSTARQKKSEKQELDIDGRKVTVSNLSKVLYPDSGFTKAQVIDYYIRVSPYLLPHFKEKPVTLKRFPDGVQGEAFYEKDKPRFAPDWIQTFPVPRRTGGADIQYILINDVATLVWCANAASLELHPFLHRVPEIQQPAAIVFDLDPGEGMHLKDCANVAFLLRAILKDRGLECFAKVSGSKGIQLYVPLNGGETYETTQPFAHTLAKTLAEEHPNLIVAEMAKVQRRGRIFIDWSQNSDFKTTVGVYSLRAKTGTPFVSLPVTWEELERDPDELRWKPDDALARLNEIGDLFAPVLSMRQSLTKKKRVQAKRVAMPKSVTPGVDLDALPKSSMTFAEPMQCKLVEQLPSGTQWQYEIKLDGYRAEAIKQRGEASLLSRRNNSFNNKYDTIVQALAPLEDGLILDGEIVALDPAGKPVFNALQHYKPSNTTLVYYVFDVLAYRERDTRNLPLRIRREILRSVLPENGGAIRISAPLEAEPEALIAAVRAQGLEGLIGKRVDSRYESGDRSGSWIKFKTNKGQELVVGGYRPGGKNHFEALAVGYYEGDRLIFIAKLKNGFGVDDKNEIYERLRKLEVKTCPFANLPEPKSARRGEALTAEAMKNYVWTKPELVVQAEFADWTPSNHLRHAKFAGIREDKSPRDVTHEIP